MELFCYWLNTDAQGMFLEMNYRLYISSYFMSIKPDNTHIGKKLLLAPVH